MTTHTAPNTGALLPAGRIDWFPADDEGIEAVRAITGDWRMGRVRVDIRPGGAAAALEKYSGHNSAPLIIIELADQHQDIDLMLDRLADHCAADTRAIIVGRVNDVGLYRRLMARGVSDYLVAPVSPSVMLDVIAQAMGGGQPSRSSVMIGVTGAKGGVGATSIAQMIGFMLGQNGHDTLLVDGAGGIGTSGIAFGLEARRSFEEIQAAARQGEALADIMRRVCIPLNEHFRLLPGGRGQGPDLVDAPVWLDWLEQIRAQTGMLVLDLPGVHHPLTRQIASHLDHLVVVTTPMLSAMRLARLGIDQIQAQRGTEAPLHLVVNMGGCFQGHEVPAAAVKQAFEKEKIYSMPFLPGLYAAADTDGKGFAPGKMLERAMVPLSPMIAALAPTKTESTGIRTARENSLSEWLAPLQNLIARGK